MDFDAVALAKFILTCGYQDFSLTLQDESRKSKR